MILPDVQSNLPKADSQKGSVISDLRNHGLANAKREPFSNFLHSKPSNRQPDRKPTPNELATEEKTVTPRAKVKKQPRLEGLVEVVPSDKSVGVELKSTGENKAVDQGEQKATQAPAQWGNETKRLANADKSSVATAVVPEKAGSEESPVVVRAGKRAEAKERGTDVGPLSQVSDNAKKSEGSKFAQSSPFEVGDKKIQPKVDRVESNKVGEPQQNKATSRRVGAETSTAVQKPGPEVGTGGGTASENKVSENRLVNDLHSKDGGRNRTNEMRLVSGEVVEPVSNSKPAKTRPEKPEDVLLSSERNKGRLSQTGNPSDPMPLPRGQKSVAHESSASRDVHNNGGKQNQFENPAIKTQPSPNNTPSKIQAEIEDTTEATRAAQGGRNLGNSGVETSRSQSPKQSGELTSSTAQGNEKSRSTIVGREQSPVNRAKKDSTLRAGQKQSNAIEVNGSRLGSHDRTTNLEGNLEPEQQPAKASAKVGQLAKSDLVQDKTAIDQRRHQEKGHGAVPRSNVKGSASPDVEKLSSPDGSKDSTNETPVAVRHSKTKANSLLGLATSREGSQIAESLKRSEEHLLVGDRTVNKPLKPSNLSEPAKVAVRDGEKTSQVIANQLAGVSSIIKQIPARKVSLKQANLAKRPVQPSIQAKQQNKNSVPAALGQARTESGGIEAAFKGSDMLLAQESELNGNPQKQGMFLRDRLPSFKSTESHAGNMSDPVKMSPLDPQSHRDISVRGELVNRIAQASAELESVQGRLTQTKGQAASTAVIYREIMSTVESFRAMSSSRWSMNLEPIENLRMQLDLRMSDSQLVVQARVDRAGHALLSTGWGELQQLLAEKDVDLKSLTSQSQKDGSGTKFDSQDGRQSDQQKEKDESFLGKELAELLADFEKETQQPRKAGRTKRKPRMAKTTFESWA